MQQGPIVLITGVMASGKSTIAQSLAKQLSPSIHLRGDVFRRMVIGGRVEMSPNATSEALRQLQLRYQAAAEVAKLYSDAGFTVIYQDTIIGPVLTEVVALYRGQPLHVLVLSPRPEIVEQRERDRPKTGYSRFTVDELQKVMQSTPRIGLWIDNSDHSIAETTEAALAGMDDARIRWP
jgi:predicted kinase